ncbi:MAG: hypothetical protein A3F82_10775 [Deltaproteobacteria bacterium RIFCSPLOWO2_12_FULL_44_12]|nr:MAG: hypothetical protein A2712_08780 [Deltaproteobacteria bacterium RIFCSPHIGHO2_01_FULL_43_49]OGQ14569.1 MAG: hypothetical protein A3D22_08220 [Deltaproteobacteria bacterium RIFCSPHIGHO2_02_FULL_44_53]OGQ27955.1 MAG: hypothetical protein A3D98_06930 [Deltaproteobacteria bacterium RIFCSPHIGHO2_12_FULL_44_21]OGQ31167.1 MAG: hypothetical protein A2979_06980 [Deltaproteobacteria bacterium RIFCSPLOWO2_01_FULL_45_74]OGQ43159.1 MAG: hypothetical protein A3I70_00640 [Deltaproteobacteria bacterium 
MVSSIFKKYFIAGALVFVPLVVTIWILKIVIYWCEGIFQTVVPTSWQPISLLGFEIPGLGLLFTIFLILLTGILTRLYMGKKLISLGEKIILKIPFGRTIYQAVQQFLQVVVPGQSTFQQVVLVEYPRKGSYMLGFITGESSEVFEKQVGQKMINVFIPTTPNPTSGFLVLSPRENVTPINIPPEQAFKLIISGGTVSS